MAEISSKYLKENDFIYVAGKLAAHTKVDENGHSKIFYKVFVDELNYVARNGRFQNDRLPEKKKTLVKEEKVDKLYLWQVFFVSPHEWWDNRKQKKNPRSPDFKHKDTGEGLWLSPTDPPWVRRQLQLHDSRMEEQGYRVFEKVRSRVSTWKYDE
ncbi:Osb1 protein [Thalictrum thalictroides]|uniref:Osb1 protein n=1 Tax=Thalictrum thalictroides TaxID=46969 RepID=A0A7J6UR81_THATH|nr:Osb1 protein [Thalictrum thalictroides]